MPEVQIDTPAGEYAAFDSGGEGPDVLLLHQVASNAQVWAPLVDELGTTMRAVALDLCGHGRTRAHEETLDRLRGDLPVVVEALGLRRPLVVIENEELLTLFTGGFASIDARGVLLVGPSSAKRGAAAENEYLEVLGVDSLDVWHERTAMFATGAPGERQAFLDGRAEAAGADWVNEGVPGNQLRRYLERQIRNTPDGWERVPRRPLVEEMLRCIGEGPFGLDLYDDIAVPMWIAVATEDVTDEESEDFTTWAEASPHRRVAFLPGYGAPDSFETEPLALFVSDLALETAGVA